METPEFDENEFASRDAKLHGSMFKALAEIHVKIMLVFPSLEALRPKSKSGIQALCSLHIVIEKTKTILQHCSECSKLYLAVTGDSVLAKFEKVRFSLVESLKRLDDIEPEAIGCRKNLYPSSEISEIIVELEKIVFVLDPLEKQIGDEMITLLQQRRLDNCNESYEIESFHQIALKLGINSSRTALAERRALKKLIDQARAEDNQRKETIVSYLLHLLKKYFKFFRSDLTEDNDSQSSAPCSPTVASSREDSSSGIDRFSFNRHFSINSSFSCRSENRSGTSMIVPDDLNFNDLRCGLSPTSSNSRTEELVDSANFKDISLISLFESDERVNLEMEFPVQKQIDISKTGSKCYQTFLSVLNYEEDIKIKSETVEDIRFLLKDSDENRIIFGANGFVEALLKFLESAIKENDAQAQNVGAMALFNLSVKNDRNKELMLDSGVINLLEAMITNSSTNESTTALLLNLSCLEKAKPLIASSQAVVFLVQNLQNRDHPRCKLDSLHTLFNLSSSTAYILNLLSAGILSALQSVLVSSLGDHSWTEKAIAVLSNLAISPCGAQEIISSSGLISALATILDTGEPIEQEQAASCLYFLCNGSETCSQMVLQEGVIPALVSMSVNGTVRGQQKAQKLLMLFREQRQRDQPLMERSSEASPSSDMKPLRQSSSKKMGKALNFLWRSKSFSVGHC